jgi:hypothetical protein
MDWKQLLTSITSSVDGELRLRNAYLVTENRTLRKQIQGRVSVAERLTQRLYRASPLNHSGIVLSYALKEVSHG